MQELEPLRHNFTITRIIQVSSIENSRGLVILWDDGLLELDGIATAGQEIHAMVNLRSTNDRWILVVFMLVHTEILEKFYGKPYKTMEDILVETGH